MAAKVLSGGEALERKLADIVRGMSGASSVKIGFLEAATYPNTPTVKLRAKYTARRQKGITSALPGATGGVSVPMVAAIQEYGAPSVGIPPRPFFRNMIAAKKEEWAPAMADLAKENDYDAQKVLAIMGEAIAGQLRESIVNTNDPPNAPSTIARKGFASPLIDTGHMLASVSYEVE